ncbi:MAG: polyphosphate kinase 2 family protein [Armatimonadetes bacterium]|nr:polyphosphate kinase 2 family protein [Armatimonadota bacterium]
MKGTTRIESTQKVDLSQIDTHHPRQLDKEAAEAKLNGLAKDLEELQDLLFYAGQHGLLIVLQGMDTSGKDGTIRHLLGCTNAQSTRVAPFKVPTPEELAHDFLWRVHQQTPGKGGVTIFNRSHYEDVLVVRVHEIVPKEVWSKRYDMINRFEELLVENSTIVLKFFLHISKEEQEQRLLEREQEVEKAWKLSAGDWKEREHWLDYQAAYEAAIGKCATKEAPWIIVPADSKWYRNLVVTETIVEALRGYKEGWLKHLGDVGAKAKAELQAYRDAAK